MILLYLIGRYLRMYHEDHAFSTGRLLVVFAGTSLVNFALNGGLYLATGTVQNRFARDNTLFTIAEAESRIMDNVLQRVRNHAQKK